MDVEIANQVAGGHDFSVLGMFLRASLVVKLVMAGLVFASVLCWAIVFEKFAVIARTRRAIERFETLFWSGKSLDEIYVAATRGRPVGTAALFIAAMDEWRRSQSAQAGGHLASLVQRIEKVMEVELQRQTEMLERRLLVLATVGSISPFVGLFGTVWGIMNSFQAIAISKNTNLAVVAPGLAEALFATALGLLAAIPAVIFYNKFSHDVARLSARMENFIERHTFRGRDAGAAHRLHGGRPHAHRGRAHRAAENEGETAAGRKGAGHRHRQGRRNGLPPGNGDRPGNSGGEDPRHCGERLR